MASQGKTKLLTKVFIVGFIVAVLSFLFHPDVGQLSLMLNGVPVAEPLIRLAAIPSFLIIMLMTGILMVMLFLGVGVFIFVMALVLVGLCVAILAPFFWPILLIIFIMIALMSFNHNDT